MFQVILLGSLAGAMIPLGGLIAANENIQRYWLRNEFRHSVVAFGGGALLSAVAFVLIPDGEKALNTFAVIGWIAAGAILMAAVDARLSRRGSHRAQLVAMLSDFIPEAVALGAVIASGESSGLLLAMMIALQNLPEGFNAFREQRDSGAKTGRILRNFVGLSLIGPIAALAGFLLLADFPQVTGAIMLTAAGAILYLIFQDIAPQAKLANRHGPALGAVAGFLLGLTGHLLIG
ncbi:ZIP family zinc transporter [Yoonia maritima]|uniref:ZIP family zinc transporter n=1 Tax=Yoonia maritima TaxID=1435347 RepID=A0A2T0W267_9RHOB|nr:divalent cation transporter [Yoonia maritima]PRY79045.1 ZIP family zinc transporter [Yoonia maritima]